jgi:hypothetical protein
VYQAHAVTDQSVCLASFLRRVDSSRMPQGRLDEPDDEGADRDRERNQQDEYYASSLATGLRRKAVAPFTQDDERVYSAR